MNPQKNLVDILTKLARTNPGYSGSQIYRIKSNGGSFAGLEFVLVENPNKKGCDPKIDTTQLCEALKAVHPPGFTELTGHVVMIYDGIAELSRHPIYDFGNRLRIHILFDKPKEVVATFMKYLQSNKLITIL